MNWIIENLANIGIISALVLMVALIVVKLIKDKKSGKGGCGCGCGECAMKEFCHKK
ncbi:MAG: FeoB-associated Cys-rich membrane protein [Clostridia bacterium]|nr:FeoB-associated Cys-rich membrane protein [Clostridia bacterium]